MNVGELVTAVQRQFGDDSGIQITQTDIIRWLNQAQIDIVRKTGCLQDHKQTDSVANDGSYTLPEDTISVRRVTYNDKVLLSTTLDVADQDWGSRDVSPGVSGTPEFYYLWNNFIYLHPRPSAAVLGALDIWYIRTPATLVGVNDIPEIPAKFHEMLVRYALARAKELNEDTPVANAILADYENMILDALDEVNRPNSRSYSAVRLLPGDDW